MRQLLDPRNNIYAILAREFIAPTERVVRILENGEVLLHWAGYDCELHSARRKGLEKFSYHAAHFNNGQLSVWVALFFRSQWQAAYKLYGLEPWRDAASSIPPSLYVLFGRVGQYAKDHSLAPSDVENIFNVGLAAHAVLRKE